MSLTSPPHPDHGKRVRHKRDGRTGTISGQLVEHDTETDKFLRRRIFVRPIGGGFEWEADPADLEPT
ncbi:hypothetical protein ACFVZ3_06435 [Kitasatospora purpeofusca]|uniref:hypothetical protein n=1 Tax=Kitasatospora purpeofusca TaxID=67352 RepID=UPI003689878F